MNLLLPQEGAPTSGVDLILGFNFEEHEKRQGVRIVVRQGRRVLASFDCPDPPCYEFKVPMAHVDDGSKLRIDVYSVHRLGRPRRRLVSRIFQVQHQPPELP